MRAGGEQEAAFSASALTPCPSPKGRGEFTNELPVVHLVHDGPLSTHGLSVADELGLARRLGMCPEDVWLVAVVAESLEIGRPASDAILRQVPAAAGRIADWAGRLSSPSQKTACIVP